MALLQLDFEISYDFQVIALSSNQKPHTISWEINRILESNLEIQDFYTLKSKGIIEEFKHYKSNSEHFTFDLLCNRSRTYKLVKELPTVDYFMRFYEEESTYSTPELIGLLRKSKHVQAIYKLDVQRLKSKQVFIFD